MEKSVPLSDFQLFHIAFEVYIRLLLPARIVGQRLLMVEFEMTQWCMCVRLGRINDLLRVVVFAQANLVYGACEVPSMEGFDQERDDIIRSKLSL